MNTGFKMPLVAAPIMAMTMLLLVCAARPAHAGATLDAIRNAGTLSCGLIADEDDYSEADTHGDLSRFGTDYCRVLATEIFGNPNKVRLVESPDEPGALRALREHKTDVLFGATPNPILGGLSHLRYGPPLFLDGQGFLVANHANIHSVSDLSGKDVCFINASPAERILYDGLEPQLKTPEHRFPFSERGEMEIALLDGHCDAITGDVSWMANVRASFNNKRSNFTVLAQTISTDPFSPVTRDDDPSWSALVDWSVWISQQAELHGVSRQTVAALSRSGDTTQRRIAGALPWIGRSLGIADANFGIAIAAIGNYGEIFDRDIGAGGLGLPRDRNHLVETGGALWALPIGPLQ